jgi:hypothetical protein
MVVLRKSSLWKGMMVAKPRASTGKAIPCVPVVLKAIMAAAADPIVFDSIPVADPMVREKAAGFIAAGRVANSFEAIGTIAAIEFANGTLFEIRPGLVQFTIFKLAEARHGFAEQWQQFRDYLNSEFETSGIPRNCTVGEDGTTPKEVGDLASGQRRRWTQIVAGAVVRLVAMLEAEDVVTLGEVRLQSYCDRYADTYGIAKRQVRIGFAPGEGRLAAAGAARRGGEEREGWTDHDRAMAASFVSFTVVNNPLAEHEDDETAEARDLDRLLEALNDDASDHISIDNDGVSTASEPKARTAPAGARKVRVAKATDSAEQVIDVDAAAIPQVGAWFLLCAPTSPLSDWNTTAKGAQAAIADLVTAAQRGTAPNWPRLLHALKATDGPPPASYANAMRNQELEWQLPLAVPALMHGIRRVAEAAALFSPAAQALTDYIDQLPVLRMLDPDGYKYPRGEAFKLACAAYHAKRALMMCATWRGQPAAEVMCGALGFFLYLVVAAIVGTSEGVPIPSFTPRLTRKAAVDAAARVITAVAARDVSALEEVPAGNPTHKWDAFHAALWTSKTAGIWLNHDVTCLTDPKTPPTTISPILKKAPGALGLTGSEWKSIWAQLLTRYGRAFQARDRFRGKGGKPDGKDSEAGRQ